MKWIKFAWKNLWRNGRRTLTTLGITAIGAAAMLVFGGFMLFTFESLAEMSARGTGHVVLSHPEFFKKDEPTPMAFGLDSWRAVQDTLGKDERVQYLLPRINFTGLISNGDKSVIYMGSGIDAEREFRVHGPFLDVKEGSLLAPKPGGLPQVMLGVELARSLNARPGSVLTLLATTSQGVLNGMDMEVAGLYATGTPELDKHALMVDLAAAQELLVTERISTLSVYLYDMDMADAATRDAAAMFPALGVTHWHDLAVFYHKVRALYIRIFGLIGIVILVVVLLSVANTMSMTVMERTREIGTMRALGAFRSQVLANFMLESAIIGVVGSALGMLIAGGVTVFLMFAGIMMPPPPGMNIGYPLVVSFSLKMDIVVGAVITLITVAGGTAAARRGVKKPVVEALAHV